MNLVYTTDNKFCPKVGESLCSVFENNRDMDDINVYIIGLDISEKNATYFSELGNKYNRSVVNIALAGLEKYIDFSYDTLGWNPVVLARLVIDKVLPSEVERVLYLDGDTCNIAPLDKLWKTDLHGNVLGGCIEPTVNEHRFAELGTEGIPYINAGVLLINLKLWREERWGEKILDFYRKHNGRLFANDQDAINGALHGAIKYLPPKYNFFNIYWFYNYRMLKKLCEKRGVPYYSEEVYENSVKHPAIIHYLGEERPWRAGNHHKYRGEYKKYLEKTPWKDDPDEQGWKGYFICWDIFNTVMKPFPYLRYKIIDGLIPTFMRWRKRQRTK